MQRRSTTSCTTATNSNGNGTIINNPNSKNHAAPICAPAAVVIPQSMKPRRRKGVVRRGGSLRLYSSRSYQSFWRDLQDSPSLILVALVSIFTTASLLWCASKLYTSSWSWLAMTPLDMVNYHHHRNHKRQLHHHSDHYSSNNNNNGPQDAAADDDYDVMPFNPIYHTPDAMETLGDRSDAYARLRREMDHILPVDDARSLARVRELTAPYATRPKAVTAMHRSLPVAHHSDTIPQDDEPDDSHPDVAYDIYNCPDTPPPGYPFEWKLVDQVLHNWPVAQLDEVPSQIYQGLCVFDYRTDYEKAVAYRKAEVPFVVTHDPRIARTVERWSIPGYLSELLGKHAQHRAEYNTNGHFLYNMPKKRNSRLRRNRHRRQQQEDEPVDEPILRDFHGRIAESQRQDTKPQEIRMTFDDWIQKANRTTVGLEDEHYYFRLIGCGYMDPEGECDKASSE